MKDSIKEQILIKIRKQKQGWAFSSVDFAHNFNRVDIDKALSTLASEGDIRRVIRGVYDLPMYSSFLGRRVAPDINQVAHTLARKFNWNIYPDGNTALNYLKLSTQVVSKYIYLSSGPTKSYTIDKTILQFKHTSSKELGLKNTNAILVTQAIRALGEEHITEDFIKTLSSRFTLREWEAISKASSSVANWIYEIIKTSCQLAKDRDKENG